VRIRRSVLDNILATMGNSRSGRSHRALSAYMQAMMMFQELQNMIDHSLRGVLAAKLLNPLL
jgi:hypothetical protein